MFLSAAPPMYSPVIPVDPAYFYAANQWLHGQKAPLSVGSTFVSFSNFEFMDSEGMVDTCTPFCSLEVQHTPILLSTWADTLTPVLLVYPCLLSHNRLVVGCKIMAMSRHQLPVPTHRLSCTSWRHRFVECRLEIFFA